MALRAIVFDFDGVIANSEPLHFCAFRDLLAEEGLTLTKAEYYAEYLGFDDVGAFEAIAVRERVTWSAARVTELVARKAVMLEALERDVSVLFPGAADAIRRAAAAMPIAIASGARGEEIRRLLAREDLLTCFAAIVAAEDTAVSKPAPDPYLRALAQLAPGFADPLHASDCIAIEDSHWGLESARAAGLRTVAVTTTYRAEDLTADLTITSLEAMNLDFLRGLCSA
ncbi:MAG: Phosphorylated carbohydrates phosphatase [Acidobacteria bacterium]|nr:Phosphorylated carbohydrates phosphatase [Acidobacteriota bacterium]